MLEQRWLARQQQASAARESQVQLRGRLATLQQALALEEACMRMRFAATLEQQPAPMPRQSSLSRTSTRTVWHLPRSLSGGSGMVLRIPERR